jgi:putative heme-binding domain-containing protein
MKRFTVLALLLIAASAVLVGRGASQAPGTGAKLPELEIVSPGFEVQLVYEVPLEEQGSWVSLGLGPDGSLYASDQGKTGTYRIRVGGTLDAPTAEVTRLPVAVSGAQGLQWAFDSLYANVNGTGLYRIGDTNGDNVPDTADFLGISDGGGEHGVHDVILTEDGKGLYYAAGNHSPTGEFTSSTVTNWQEDLILPREWDARGHARGILAPGGFILRINPDATERRVISMGYRNEYGLALNAHDELFTYDSDMEWDVGSPWYRPTRIVHVTSGSEYGWRSGSGKWPAYYEDSLPGIVDVGPGSPTGVVSGQGTKFPAKYQHAIYALDWTYGTIYAVHLTPKGSSYTAELEEFVTGVPLAVTDAEVGQDGYLYFTVGGRGGQSKLYRVVYRGNESTAPTPAPDTDEARAARALRKQLEAFHGRQDPAAVDAAWPHLSSEDRFLRWAARVAVEWQPIDTWAGRAYAEPNPQARIAALVALARNGTAQHREAATKALLDLDPGTLTADQKLGMLRAFQLVFMRLGEPEGTERTQVIEWLHQMLPDQQQDARVNQEVVRTLIALDDNRVTAVAMRLIRDRPAPTPPDWSPTTLRRSERYGGEPLAQIQNPSPLAELNYAFMLRTHRPGWTTELRRQYFEFLNEVAALRGGASYAPMLEMVRAEALRNTSPVDREAVADLTGRSFAAAPDFEITPPEGPGREWTLADASKVLAPATMTGRNFERGRSLFFSVGCGSCHRLNQYGGDVGPDLTTVASRFNTGRILEKVITPNEAVADQYLSSEVRLTDGRVLTGLPLENGDDTVTVHPPDPGQEPTTVPRSQVVSIQKMTTSVMPPGLINSLNEDELRDLIAYLQSGGNPQHRMFQPTGTTPPQQ